MSFEELSYTIRFRLPARAESPAVIGRKFLTTIDALSGVDPIFSDWQVIDVKGQCLIPLSSARPRIEAIVEKNVYRDDWKRPRPHEGYHFAAMTGSEQSPRCVNLGGTAGGNRLTDITFVIGYVHIGTDPTLVTYPVYKAALLTINSIWSPIWSNACAFEVGYWKQPLFEGAPLFPYSVFHMSWIGYLSAQFAAGLTPPADLITERTPDGGLVMSAVTERLDPTNPEHLCRSRTLAEIMMARTGDTGK